MGNVSGRARELVTASAHCSRIPLTAHPLPPMLTELRVRDLATIADVTLHLGAGLNVLTGETGAGKSMLVDALALLLGERAAGGSVRPGAAKAIVEGAFEGIDARTRRADRGARPRRRGRRGSSCGARCRPRGARARG